MIKLIFLADPSLAAEIKQLGLDTMIRICDLAEVTRAESFVNSSRARVDNPEIILEVPIGVICSCDYYEGRFEELSEWLCRAVPFRLPDGGVFQHEVGDLEGLGKWIMSRLHAIAAYCATECASVGLAQARLRFLFEQSQSSLASLEQKVRLSHASHILFQIFPEQQYMQIENVPLELVTGIAPAAVHAIDLFFKKADVLSNGKIIVQIRGEHSGRVFDEWRVREGEIKDGWNRFHCSMRDCPIGEALILSVRADGLLPEVLLSMGKPVTNAFKNALLGSFSNLRPFSVRVWSGIVGIQLPRSDLGHLPAAGGVASNDSSARATDLLQLASPGDNSEPSEAVGWSEHHCGLMVHPYGRVPSIAKVEKVKANGLLRLTAQFVLANPEATATEFAIWAAPHQKQQIVVEDKLGKLMSRVSGGSARKPAGIHVPENVTWVALMADESGEVSFDFGEPFSGEIDVYFATRNLGKENYYSWAIFKELLFDTI